MRRGTIILGLFVVISLGIVGISQFLRRQPPVQLTIAVDPLAQHWVETLAREFNAQEVTFNGTRRVEVLVTSGNLTVVDDIDVWNATEWTAGTPPNLWVPASASSVEYASRLPFTVLAPSIARTPLVFAVYSDRAGALQSLDSDAAALSWNDIAEAASLESWQAIGDAGASTTDYFKIVFLSPSNSAEGLGVLYSAAAAHSGMAQLTASAVRGDFCDWFEPVIDRVPNFNTIGDDVAVHMAQRGRSAADVGVAPESRWLPAIEQLNNNAPVQFYYPAYPYVFDFPVALWDEENTTDQTRSAAQTFVDWLLQPAQQSRMAGFGLRPVNGAPDQSASLFADGAAYGIRPDLPLDNPIQQPSANDTRSMLGCF